MSRFYATLSVTLLALATLFQSSRVLAAPQKSAPATLSVSFRVHVNGHVPAGSTFWLAYGPLNGQWGIVQLQHSGRSLYAATRRIPASQRGVFTFLTAQGIRHTRLGAVPGGIPVVIAHLGPIFAAQLQNRIVQWEVPRG